MKSVPLDTLANKIVQPGIEKHLTPLLAYRGAVTLGRAHRCWNLLLSMKEHECTVADATQRLMHNSDYSQLCLPERPLQHVGLCSFVSRLRDNPKVMALEPGLEEYLDDIGLKYTFSLTRINPISHRSRHKGAGGWRELVLRKGGMEPIPVPDDFAEWATGKSVQDAITRFHRSPAVIQRWFSECNIEPEVSARYTPALAYPFIIHDRGTSEHQLLRAVNDAVPRYLSPDMRADICQDLVVGILCGDFPQDDLGLPAKEMMKRVFRMFPTKYGPASLDAALPGYDDLTLMDTLADDAERRWDMA